MRIIRIIASPNGGHANQTTSANIPLPSGWAIIPETMEIPETFPFVDLEVEGKYVTKMTAGIVPPAPPAEPTAEELLEILLGEEENDAE